MLLQPCEVPNVTLVSEDDQLGELPIVTMASEDGRRVNLSMLPDVTLAGDDGLQPRELPDVTLASEDDVMFLLPLTALDMEEDALRQDLGFSERGGEGELFLSPASAKTFWLSE